MVSGQVRKQLRRIAHGTDVHLRRPCCPATLPPASVGRLDLQDTGGKSWSDSPVPVYDVDVSGVDWSTVTVKTGLSQV